MQMNPALIAKQPEQAKHYIAGTRRVGHDFGGSQSGLLLKQPLQNKNGIP